MNNTTPTELSYWLQLAQIPNAGIVSIQKLLTQFHSPEGIFKATTQQLHSAHLSDAQIHSIKNPNQKEIERALHWITASPNHHIIPFTDSRYPTLLAEITHFPLILYVSGNADLLSRPQIAIVGSRKASYTGLELATEFARALSQAGLIITSGLALGIDAASHEAALQAAGETIAVLGSGLCNIYPKRNEPLAKRISQRGCVISELPLLTPPNPENFPRRNRIISGLSLGTLIIEAAPQSGSLITARFALEQNRDVFAVPGSPRNPMAKGCLSLIQQGAKCVTCVEDILNEIRIFPANILVDNGHFVHLEQKSTLDSTEQQVLACIEDTTTIDQICARSKLSAQIVTTTLLQLALKDIVKSHYAGYVKL